MEFRAKVDFEAAKRQLSVLGAALRNPRGLLRDLAEWLLTTARAAFQKQRSPEEVLWAPLSLRYQEFKAKMRPGRNILQYSGALGRAFISGEQGNVAFVENPLPYAAAHQYGIADELQWVSDHTRRQSSRDVFTGGTDPLRGFKTKRRQTASGIAHVRGFIRVMRIPARPYLPGVELSEREGAKIVEENLAEQIRKGEGGR